MPEPCIFCKRPIQKKSLEHVIPKWLLAEMGMSKKLFTGKRFSVLTGETTGERSHPAISNVCGGVCEECNSGWMSSLENEVRPFLPRMIQGETVSLLPQERLSLSRWLAKTVYVANMASPSPTKTPSEHLHSLFQDADRLPERVIIVLGYNPDFVDLESIHHSAWQKQFIQELPTEEMEQINSASYKYAIQIGHLMAMVACWNADGFIYGIEKGLHKPLYPKRFEYAEMETAMIGENLTQLQLFHRLLCVLPAA